MREIQRGDRVCIKRSEADCYIQPFRRFAETGRKGTVTGIIGTELPAHRREARIIFDTKRKGAAQQVAAFRFADLEIVDD